MNPHFNRIRQHKYFPLSDQKFCIALDDVMGTDSEIVKKARTSYGKDTTKGAKQFLLDCYSKRFAKEVIDFQELDLLGTNPGDSVLLTFFTGTQAVVGNNMLKLSSEEMEKYKKRADEDISLLRRLLRDKHTSPFEMCEIIFFVEVPMDCWRQWVRHRTACLAGDVELVFNRPVDDKAYRLTVKEVFDKFQPTVNATRPDKQKNAFYKKERVQSMQLRCLDEDTMKPSATSIVDIWQSGVKPVYKVITEYGDTIRCSKDHLIRTPSGWFQLKDLKEGAVISTLRSKVGTPQPTFNEIDPETEEWVPIKYWEDYYEISSQGRVRRIIGGKGSRSHGRCKKLTVNNGRAVTSLNRPGQQEVIQVHRYMLLSFDIEPDNEDQVSVCHNDGNSLNNTLDNLRWGTPKENSEDMVTHGTSTELSHVPAKIVSITYDGEEMTYDLEVEGPYHNFSANNIVVHNSINEYSTRYMEALDHFQITPADEWRLQSKSNKQGSKSYITDWPDLEEDSYISTNMLDAIDCGVVPEEYLTNTEQDLHTHIRNVYKERLKLGISREQARKDLPLSTMTRAYWKCDLHNIFHFLNLRMDEHAQYEIRSYAHCMFNIVSELFPIASQAFKDYRLDAVTFSRMEMECIKKIPDCYHHLIENGKPHNMTDNEWTAFLKKLS